MTDLVDPTEARYASVAQEMFLSKEWLTPLLPLPEGVVPYLGKPPLHFWLTLISYKLFGVDEWTSRLPSIVSSLLIVAALLFLQRMASSIKQQATSILLLFVSPVFFFFSGASVIDVTLSACTTVSLTFLYAFFQNEKCFEKKYAIYSALAAAAGFLTKGPVALVLIGVPLILFLFIQKKLSALKQFPWILSFFTFLAIVAPWFILSEIHSPGFLEYFFWNENIARYLLKNYGDKYGSGHQYPRGMSILLFIAGSIPLFFVLGAWMKKYSLTRLKTVINSDPLALFSLLAALTPPFFFALVKQMHIGYIIPGIPWLSLFITQILFYKDEDYIWTLSRGVKLLIFIVGLTLFVGFCILESTPFSVITSLILLGFLALCLRYKLPHQLELQRTLFAIIIVLALCITSASPMVNLTKSTEEILKALTTETKNLNENSLVGIYTENTFSHYWISKNVENELSAPVTMKYVKPLSEVSPDIKYLLVRNGSEEDLSAMTLKNFVLKRRIGKWSWYERS